MCGDTNSLRTASSHREEDKCSELEKLMKTAAWTSLVSSGRWRHREEGFRTGGDGTQRRMESYVVEES